VYVSVPVVEKADVEVAPVEVAEPREPFQCESVPIPAEDSVHVVTFCVFQVNVAGVPVATLALVELLT
jgi:hypothetical protein